MANIQVPERAPRRDLSNAPGGLFANNILRAVFNYDDTEMTEFRKLAHPSSTLFRYLLHHCVLELEFSRAYVPRSVVLAHGLQAGEYPRGYPARHNLNSKESKKVQIPNVLLREMEYRQRRSNAGPEWLGSPRRRMLCTLDEFFLQHQIGRTTFAYSGMGSGAYLRNRRPRKNAAGWKPKHPAVWDLLWKDWREIPTDQTVTILAAFPTSMGLHDLTRRSTAYRPTVEKVVFKKISPVTTAPGGTQAIVTPFIDTDPTLPDTIVVDMWSPGTKEEERTRKTNEQLLATQMSVFQQLYSLSFSNMSTSDRYYYMEGHIDLHLQEKIRKMQLLMAKNKPAQDAISRIDEPQLPSKDKNFIKQHGEEYAGILPDGSRIFMDSIGMADKKYVPADMRYVFTRTPEKHLPPPPVVAPTQTEPK